MNDTLTIDEIIQELQTAETEFTRYCLSLDDRQFFFQPPGKWSAAQQVKHLIISANATRKVYILPKFLVRWITGKPNRHSRTYSQLLDRYKQKLAQGGRASSKFFPPPVPENYGKEKLLGEFTQSMHRLSGSIGKNWKDQQTDRYLAPHPLLGKITLRELGYFTILHTYHHLNSIRSSRRIAP